MSLVHATDGACDVSVVVIGRNEGERLSACLRSVQGAHWSALRHAADGADGCPQNTTGTPELLDQYFHSTGREADFGQIMRRGGAAQIEFSQQGFYQKQIEIEKEQLTQLQKIATSMITNAITFVKANLAG